jgi:general secretion pathway protein G
LQTELLEKDEKNVVEAGFTLVELLIVIVIMGILAGIVVFAVGNLTSSASSNACKTEADTLTTAAEAHKATYGSYPAAVADLVTAHTPPDATGSGLLKSTPKKLTTAPAGAGFFSYTVATNTVDTSAC